MVAVVRPRFPVVRLFFFKKMRVVLSGDVCALLSVVEMMTPLTRGCGLAPCGGHCHRLERPRQTIAISGVGSGPLTRASHKTLTVDFLQVRLNPFGRRGWHRLDGFWLSRWFVCYLHPRKCRHRDRPTDRRARLNLLVPPSSAGAAAVKSSTMLAPIAGFRDPWQRPLRSMAPDRMKRLNATEKEARLLVATWQGRKDEINRIENSGKPAPRSDLVGMTKVDKEIKLGGKAGRGKTKLVVTQFPQNDLYRWGTPLHKAAFQGEVEIVRELLSTMTGSKALQLLDEKTEAGNTPLHHAAFRGSVPCVEAILDTMSDVEVNVNRQEQRDDVKGVRMINASLAAIKCRNLYLSTPLDKAREANQIGAMRMIESWAGKLKRRQAVTEQLRKIVDEYESKPKELDTRGLRALLADEEKMPLPRVKPDLITRATQLVRKAENLT